MATEFSFIIIIIIIAVGFSLKSDIAKMEEEIMPVSYSFMHLVIANIAALLMWVNIQLLQLMQVILAEPNPEPSYY